MKDSEDIMRRLVAELHAQPVRRSPGEGGFAESGRLDQAIKATLKRLRFGG